MTTSSSSKFAPSRVPINPRWCNRALRPLTSIYLRLEKHWKASSLRDEEYVRRACNGKLDILDRTRYPGKAPPDPAGASDSESSKEDPTWVPGEVARKPIKHRYSGRKEQQRLSRRSRTVLKSPQTEKLQPGQFSIATPLILGKRRALDVKHPPDALGEHNAETDTLRNNRSFSSLKHKSLGNDWSLSEIAHGIEDTYNDPSYVAIVQKIFSAWDTFLRMSNPELNHRRGARSLLSMALRTTSEYIIREQERLDSLEERDEEADVADFIITELEATYAMGGDGWKPLKELVRLHGINLMCEAIRKKWISPQLSCRLTLQAIAISADDAAEALLLALSSRSPAIPPPISLESILFEPSQSVALHTLEGYVRASGNLSILFTEMANLFDQRRLPPEWLATESVRLYLIAALKSLSVKDEHSFASSRLIASAVLAATGSRATISSHVLGNLRRSKRGATQSRTSEQGPSFTSRETNCHDSISYSLRNFVNTLLSMLVGSHFARTGMGKDQDSTSYALLRFISTAIQRNIEIAALGGRRSSSLEIQPIRASVVLMSDLLVNYLNSSDETPRVKIIPCASPVTRNFGYLTGLHISKKELIKELAYFVLQVVQCIKKVMDDGGFAFVKPITLIFRYPSIEREPTLQRIFSKVAVDVALEFAESTYLQLHHDWASYIQNQVAECEAKRERLKETQNFTPSLRPSSTGFKWEDSIGEWVAKTPIFRRLASTKPKDTVPSTWAELSGGRTEVSDSEATDSGFSSISKRTAITSSDSSVYSDFRLPKRKRLLYSIESRKPRKPDLTALGRTNYRRLESPKYRSRGLDGPQARLTRPRVSDTLNSSPSTQRQRSTGRPLRAAGDDAREEVAFMVEIPSRPKITTIEVVISTRHNEEHKPYQTRETLQVSDDEDVLSHAPALSQYLRRRTIPQAAPSLNKDPGSVRPRRSNRLSLNQREIPCSDESEDELSFC